MADLINGKMSKEPIAKLSAEGKFVRPESSFRGNIEKAHATSGRYHLYVSYACPWAHRTLIMRNLKNLSEVITVSVTDAYMGEEGWTLNEKGQPSYLYEVYLEHDKNYTGKVSVPVLWDQQEKTIVNNESSEIIRIFNSSFDHLTGSKIDLYPLSLSERIDEVNHLVYESVNNGVYKAGFAGDQKAYEEAYDNLFHTLDKLEDILSRNNYLVGEYFTEADIRLFTTLIRFDPVYVVHFKCNKKRISDYPNLHNYMKSIYQMPEVKSTCNFEHIKEHYFTSHKWINPTGIIPKGPELDLDSPHNRKALKIFSQKRTGV